MSNKLPKLLIKKTGDYRVDGAYLVTVPDINHHEKIVVNGEGGKEFILYKPDAIFSGDMRNKFANQVKVEASFGDTCFIPGDVLRVEHACLVNNSGKYDPFYVGEDGTNYFKVMNYAALFKIENNELVPRDYILLCEPIEDKAYETTLDLSADLIFNRRDLVRVVRVWEGCTDYKEGDLILIEKNSDYPLQWNKKDYVKVDTFSGQEVLAIVGSTGWRKKEVHRHAKHNTHGSNSNPMPIQ